MCEYIKHKRHSDNYKGKYLLEAEKKHSRTPRVRVRPKKAMPNPEGKGEAEKKQCRTPRVRVRPKKAMPNPEGKGEAEKKQCRTPRVRVRSQRWVVLG